MVERVGGGGGFVVKLGGIQDKVGGTGEVNNEAEHALPVGILLYSIVVRHER